MPTTNTTNSAPNNLRDRERPTPPLRSAFLGTAALVAALSSTAAADIIDSPSGFALRSQGSISLGNNSAVHGSLGAAGASSFGNNVTITGSVETGSPHSWVTPTISPIPAWGSQSVSLGSNQSIALAPGAYNAFSSASGTTVQLSAGDYVFSSFQLGNSGRVTADTSAGDVYLYVGNALSSANQTTFERSGAGRLFIITGGSASFGNGAEISASLYSFGSQSFSNNVRLEGLTWSGGSISAGNNSLFTFQSPVPAPSAVALIALASAIGFRRRRI